jgi:hypothetical protein
MRDYEALRAARAPSTETTRGISSGDSATNMDLPPTACVRAERDSEVRRASRLEGSGVLRLSTALEETAQPLLHSPEHPGIVSG